MFLCQRKIVGLFMAVVAGLYFPSYGATVTCSSATRTDGDKVEWHGSYTLDAGQWFWNFWARIRLAPNGAWNDASTTIVDTTNKTWDGYHRQPAEVNVRGKLEYWDDGDQMFHTATSNILTV